MSNIIFPTLKSSNWKLRRSPMFTTITQTSSSNKVTSAALQSSVLWKWKLQNGVLQSAPAIADLQAIQNLFVQMYGMYDSFLWPDPEPSSITIGFQSLYPVKFTNDIADFDRFAYQLWECGELEFRQVQAPTLISTGGDTGQFPPVVQSAVLSVTWSYTPTTYAAYASLNVGYPTKPASIHAQGGFGTRTDSVNVDLNLVSGLSASFYLDGSFSGSGLARLQIFDVSLVITNSDTTTQTLKPTTTSFDAGSGTGTVLNAGSAIDGNTGTAAELQTSNWGPVLIPPVFSLSSFA
jgi:hypothetical protein